MNFVHSCVWQLFLKSKRWDDDEMPTTFCLFLEVMTDKSIELDINKLEASNAICPIPGVEL